MERVNKTKNIIVSIIGIALLVLTIIFLCLYIKTHTQLQDTISELKNTTNELNNTKNELLIANNEIDTLNLKVLDYSKVYGDINRNDIQNNINESQADQQVLLMSKENPNTIIQFEKTTIQFSECVYNQSDNTLQIGLDINNNSNEPLDIQIVDVYGNNNTYANILEDNASHTIDPGTVSSYYYFDASSVQNTDISQVGNVHCKLIINSQNGENLYSKNIVILNEMINN